MIRYQANTLAFKKRGVWTKHYTMSLWKNEEEMKAFALSGAHLEAMKNLRLNEAQQVRARFERLGLPLEFVDASDLFLDLLAERRESVVA